MICLGCTDAMSTNCPHELLDHDTLHAEVMYYLSRIEKLGPMTISSTITAIENSTCSMSVNSVQYKGKEQDIGIQYTRPLSIAMKAITTWDRGIRQT